jgi:outer membrane translocation and assembly module TamA
MMNFNAELRIPLFNNAWAVLFQDVGLLSSDQFADFKPDHIAAGTGFGVRYLTPIGPLRFDVAWKWRREAPNEHSYNWFLTFGQAF